jgi:UDP:flavonoid glycosyltransferase YjiC (YdhE family)
VPRILLAWEFGGDLGHVRRTLAIARTLRDRGHQPLLAFADVGSLRSEDPGEIEFVPAPLLPRPAAPDLSPLNASDILLNLGLGDPASLAGALAAWATLIRLWQPDALVADYAPTALLAARIAGLRRIGIGTGFSMPPTGEPMPGLRPWISLDPAELTRRDARLVDAVREAFARAAPRGKPPARAAELFRADANLVCTWPPFDPFGPRDDVEYLGPQSGAAQARVVAWSSDARPRIFAYLKPRDPRFAATIEALHGIAGEALVAAPGLSEREAATLSKANVRVIAEPVELELALDGVDLCLSHGSVGIVAAAAAAGAAQALLPTQLEHYLVSRRMRESGAAVMIEPDRPAQELAAWIAAALTRSDLRACASAAREAASRPAASAAERIERLLVA